MKTPLALCAALAACSGSGGSPPAPTGPELAIVSMTPAPDAVVPIDATVEVVFGEDIDINTLIAGGFVVADGSGPLVGTYLYDNQERRIAFAPEPTYPLGMPLHATVTTQLRSTTGHALATDRTVSFRVVDGSMQPSFAIGTGAIGPPRCAAMQFGHALLAHGNTVWRVEANQVVGQATLADPVQGLQFARNGTNAAALGMVSGISSFRVSVSTSLSGDTWTAPRNVVERQDILAGIELLANGRGDLVVRWTARTTTQPSATVEGVVRAMFEPAFEPRFAPVDVGPPSLVRSLDLDGQGRLFHGVPDPAGVRVLRVDGNGAQLDLPVAPPGSTLIGVRADGGGRMLALYQTGSGSGADLRTRCFDPATGLGQEKICFSGDATVAAFAFGERGDGALALAVPSVDVDVWAATYLGSTGEWTPAAAVLPGAMPFFDGGAAASAVSPRGIAWLACVRPQPGNLQELVLLRAAPGGAFGAPMHVETSAPGMRFLRPALAADTGGRAVVFWQLRDLASTVAGELRAATFQ